MNIFVISRGYPTLRLPQLGCFEKDQAIALANLGHKVVVLSMCGSFKHEMSNYGISSRLIDNIWVLNVMLLPLGMLKLFLPLKIVDIFKDWQMRLLYKRAIKLIGEPDIIYAHYLYNSERAVRMKKIYPYPIVGIEHWSKVGSADIDGKTKKLAEQTYKHLDALLVVSKDLQTNIKKNFGIDSIVVNDMVGPEFFYEPWKKTTEIIKYVTAGSLVPIKAFDVLIMAFSLSGLPKYEWELTICGEGPEHENLQHMIEELDLCSNIHLVGRQNKEGVVRYLKESDVFILSSHQETFGLAPVEALACGLPVIATRCGGPDEFMTSENGVMVPVNDPEAMAEAIKYMHKHKDEYNRKAISEGCLAKYSPNIIAKQLSEIFERTIKDINRKL